MTTPLRSESRRPSNSRADAVSSRGPWRAVGGKVKRNVEGERLHSRRALWGIRLWICGDELTGSVTESSQSLLRNDGGFTLSHFLVSQCGHYTLYLVHVDGGWAGPVFQTVSVTLALVF